MVSEPQSDCRKTLVSHQRHRPTRGDGCHANISHHTEHATHGVQMKEETVFNLKTSMIKWRQEGHCIHALDDDDHFLLQCTLYDDLRQVLKQMDYREERAI